MPLNIAAAAWMGWWLAGLVPATAMLLGAVISPTDPVLARPVAGLIGLVGTELLRRKRLAVFFFGIRGIGSIYYLAYGVCHADFQEAMVIRVISNCCRNHYLFCAWGHGMTSNELDNY